MEFSEYVANRRARLVRSAVLLGCSEADAEDVVQTALSRALRAWRKVQRAESPDAYMQRILLNTLRDAKRRRWSGEVPTEKLPDSGIDDGAERHAEGLAVRHALAAMSPEHREVLVLRFYADLTERDTALALGVAPGTVKSRTSRALRALAADLDTTRSQR